MNTKQNYKNLKKQCRCIFKNQVFSFITAILSLFLQMHLIIQMQVLVDAIISKGEINKLLICFALEITFFFIINFLSQYFFRILTALGKNRITTILYENAIEKNFKFFMNTDSGELNSLISNDAQEVGLWIANGLLIRLIQIVSLSINIILLLKYSIFLTIILLICIFICFFIVHLISKKAAIVTEEEFKIKANMTQFLIESFHSIISIKILRKENFFESKFKSLINDLKYPIDKKSSILTALYMSITIILMQMLPLVSVAIGVILVTKGNITIGSIVSIYALTGKLQEPVRIIAQSLNQEKAIMKLVNRLSTLLPDENLKLYKTETSIEKIEKISIHIKNFSYDNTHYILTNVNLEIKPNELIIIKGESGSGKSTLANIILGIIELKNGNIKINGINISNLSQTFLLENILLKNQENLIIQGTVRENISFGDKYSTEEIKEILKVVCLENFINEYGIDKELFERGKNLSGGQKQRITLARTLIRKPNVLILDEPTSSLDEYTSKKITSNIVEFSNKNNITLIVISHKNDFDNYSNKIVFIKN